MNHKAIPNLIELNHLWLCCNKECC